MCFAPSRPAHGDNGMADIYFHVDTFTWQTNVFLIGVGFVGISGVALGILAHWGYINMPPSAMYACFSGGAAVVILDLGALNCFIRLYRKNKASIEEYYKGEHPNVLGDEFKNVLSLADANGERANLKQYSVYHDPVPKSKGTFIFQVYMIQHRDIQAKTPEIRQIHYFIRNKQCNNFTNHLDNSGFVKKTNLSL
jgi:hypothetical protein